MSLSPDQIDDKQLEAFQHALAQSVIGIVGKDDYGEFGKQLGTGTLINHRGTRSILTAEHVVRGCSLDELRFLLPAEGMRIANPGEPLKLQLGEVFKREPMPLQAIRQDPTLDIAVLTIMDNAAVPAYWNFRELRTLTSPLQLGARSVMMGYPARRAVPYVDGNLIGIRNIDYPEVKSAGSVNLEGFDPSLHFLVDFPSVDEFNPGGYSGGGIWFRGPRSDPDSDGLWFSDPQYAGMVLSYYERKQLIKVLKVDVILDFLQN